MPWRVAFISIVPSPYQRDLFCALNQRDEIELHVFYCEKGSPDSPWNKQPPRSFETILPGFYLSWGGSRFLINRHLPDFSSFDLIILNGYMTLLSQRVLRKWVGRKPILFWGEAMVGEFSGLKGFVQRRLANPLKSLDGIVAIGTKAESDYKRRYPSLKIENIPYYCQLDTFQNGAGEKANGVPKFLFCGQMIARKGVDILLSAFDRLIQEGSEAELLLIGREADVHKMLANCSEKARQHIEYGGFQQPEDLPKYFKQASIFVLPSRYDGWGVVVNQALGAGLPLICSDQVGAAKDLIEQEKNGLIFVSENTDSLFQCLRRFADDPEFIKSAAQSSLEKAKAWTPEAGAEKWIQVIEKFIP